MLKARDDERHDREKHGQDLARDGLGRAGHPDGDADKEIAQDPAHKRIAERQGRLRLRDGDHRRRQPAVKRSEHMPQHAERRDEHRTHEIAQIDNAPVAQHPPCRDHARQNAHDHEIVAGEQLAAGHDDHGEAGRKDTAGDELRQRRIAHRSRGRRGRDACQRDERPRQTGEQKHPPQRQRRLDPAGRKIILRNFFWRVHRQPLQIGARYPVRIIITSYILCRQARDMKKQPENRSPAA